MSHINLIMTTTEFIDPIVRALGRAIYSLNPSLIPTPTPIVEVTGSDICRLGPNGESDQHLVVLCRDFDGPRSLVASWYLSPERHGLEMCILTPIFALVLWKTIPSLVVSGKSLSGNDYNHPFGIPTLSACCMVANIAYKSAGRKLLFLCMPCNVQWGIAVLLCFGNLSGSAFRLGLQFMASFGGYTLVALATPDTEDCTFPYEAFFFWFSHISLLAIPTSYLVTGRLSVLSSSEENHCTSTIWLNVKWWLVSSSAFGLFYFFPVSFLSILSGSNLNYMMSPPPGQDVIVGEWYRVQSIGYCAALIALTRFALVLGEVLLFSTSRKSKRC